MLHHCTNTDQQHVTISEEEFDRYQLMVPQDVKWPSIAGANGQLNMQCRYTGRQRSADTWRCSAFMTRTTWTRTMALPWWHHLELFCIHDKNHLNSHNGSAMMTSPAAALHTWQEPPKLPQWLCHDDITWSCSAFMTRTTYSHNGSVMTTSPGAVQHSWQEPPKLPQWLCHDDITRSCSTFMTRTT